MNIIPGKNTVLIGELHNKVVSVIRTQRISLGLTQKEFAELVEVNYISYRKFEQKGKLSLENFILILAKINKDIDFDNFLKGFEIPHLKSRVRKHKQLSKNNIYDPIVPIINNYITLDKNIFGNELFYSVENGHNYEISNFITIILNKINDKRMMLLLRYFGKDRLKPFVLKQRNIELLKMFNAHIDAMENN